MGDPAGIGPDISLLTWQRRRQSGVPAFFLIADVDVLIERAAALGLDIPMTTISAPGDAHDLFPKALPVLPQTAGVSVMPGTPDISTVPAIVGAIERGVRFARDGEAAAVVTNPVSKVVLQKGGFGYPGHTEFLGVLAREKDAPAPRPVMMLVSAALRVVPLTVHIPLKDVPRAISRKLIVQTAQTIVAALKRDFACPTQRLAVAGLNPHAGESGTIGREEHDIIEPAIRDLRDAGYAVTGPHSADTLFHCGARRNYDAVLAMYHDQALIPLKTLAFDNGVNVTLGLPFIRTSPDHGTAFDLAGKGNANPQSLVEALLLARRIFENIRMADHDA